jgi:hypothetical protein
MSDIVERDAFERVSSGFFPKARFATARRPMLQRLFRRVSDRGIAYDPYDVAIRSHLADHLFGPHQADPPCGTVERGRVLLDIIQETFPAEALGAAYFANLDKLLGPVAGYRRPGKVVIGIGSGRNGSTSLAELLSTIDGVCCTHENPPLMGWRPEPEELRFHMRRLRRMADHFPFVIDAHWWLNAVDELIAHFPDAKVIGVRRDVESCTHSFMKIKGTGFGSCNHWAPYGNGIWSAALWDPTYPTFSVPEDAREDPDGAKFQLIKRYVREYNDALRLLAARSPGRVMVLRTEELNDPTVQKTLFDFVGARGEIKTIRLNAGTTIDGRSFRKRHLI